MLTSKTEFPGTLGLLIRTDATDVVTARKESFPGRGEIERFEIVLIASLETF